MKRAILLCLLLTGVCVAAPDQDPIWNEPWYTYLIPACPDSFSGMDVAVRDYPFLADTGSYGYAMFLGYCGNAVSQNYEFFAQKNWAYSVAALIEAECKKQGMSVTDRSPLDKVEAAKGAKSSIPLIRIVGRAMWLADPGTEEYARFFEFCKNFPDQTSLTQAVTAFYQSQRAAPQTQAVPKSSPQYAPIGSREKEEDDARAERRRIANANNKARAQASNAQRDAERAAAASAPRVNVYVSP